jgi:hypothetical protein
MNTKIDEFSRYEFKYVLRAGKAQLIEDEIRNFMYYDKFVESLPDQRYPVRSLYFENNISSNFYEKVDGLKTRRKFRLRTYTSDANDEKEIFFELKGKHNERTYKQRVRIDENDLAIFENPNRAFELLDLYPAADFIETYVFEAFRKQLRPMVLVDYMRRPYVSDYDTNFRVTIDSGLRSCASQRLRTGDHQFRACIAGHSVIEVKFHRRIPLWFHRLIQTYDLRRVSISKFVVGMKTCDLAIDLS